LLASRQPAALPGESKAGRCSGRELCPTARTSAVSASASSWAGWSRLAWVLPRADRAADRYARRMRKMALGATASMFLVLGCGSTSPKPTQTTAPATKSVAATPAAFLPSDCANQVERPSSFIIACADAGSGVEHLVWRSWGGPVAQGSGFAFANDCEPSCVAGGMHHAAAEMYVSRLRKCGGKLQYTYAVIIASKASIADRTTGAYDIACGGPNSHGVSRTEPEAEPESAVAETVHAPNAPSDQEIREALREAIKHKGTK